MEIALIVGKFLLPDIEGSSTTIENILRLGIGAFSIILLALSISAYRKSGLKKIAYAATAFALFAIQLFFGILEDTIKSFGTVYINIISYAMTLTILILFFLAIVKRK